MLCYIWCFVFLFFKQKTAYEMRISDWSSDVCSSDLFGTLAANVATLGPVSQEVLDAFELGAKNRFFDRRLSVNTALFYYQYEGKQAGLSEIGRASCRERVCKYV